MGDFIIDETCWQYVAPLFNLSITKTETTRYYVSHSVMWSNMKWCDEMRCDMMWYKALANVQHLNYSYQEKRKKVEEGGMEEGKKTNLINLLDLIIA